MFIVFQKEGTELTCSISILRNDEKCKYIFMFAKLNSGGQPRVNTIKPRQNGWHFAEDISKYNFLNENCWISKDISLKYVPRGLVNNMSALVQVMAWCTAGNKPLPEPMMTQIQDKYMHHLLPMHKHSQCRWVGDSPCWGSWKIFI